MAGTDLFYIIDGRIEVKIGGTIMKIPAKRDLLPDGRVRTLIAGGVLGHYFEQGGLQERVLPLDELEELGFKRRTGEGLFTAGDFEVFEDERGIPYVFHRERMKYRYVMSLTDENNTL